MHPVVSAGESVVVRLNDTKTCGINIRAQEARGFRYPGFLDEGAKTGGFEAVSARCRQLAVSEDLGWCSVAEDSLAHFTQRALALVLEAREVAMCLGIYCRLFTQLSRGECRRGR